MNLFLYVSAETWLHRADPRTKTLAMLCVFVLALGLDGEPAVILLGGAVLAAGFGAGFGSRLRRAGGLLALILLATTAIWGLTAGGGVPWGPLAREGARQGFMMGIRLVIMVTAGLIWLSTTRVEEMTAGMEKLGVPFPVAFAFSTAIRLVPWIVSGCRTISEAQQSRGLDLRRGTLTQRLRKYVPLLVPALVAVIRNANHFSMALESRGFGSGRSRTPYLRLELGRNDLFLLMALGVLISGCAWLNAGHLQKLFGTGVLLTVLSAGFVLVLRIAVNQESGRLLWQNTRMVVLTALSAAIYAAVVIPFKGIVLVPGISDFRPGMALPPVLGLLFGPAAAWGCGFGCVISDFFGSLGPGSFFGFAGNFAMAWVPYRLWWKTGGAGVDGPEPLRLHTTARLVRFFLLSLVGALACAFIIGGGLELLGLVPFKVLAVLIALNNSAPIVLLSLPVYLVLYPRIRDWGLLWTDILGPDGVAVCTQKSRLGAALTLTGILVGFGGGLYSVFVAGATPLPAVGVGILLLAAGAFL